MLWQPENGTVQRRTVEDLTVGHHHVQLRLELPGHVEAVLLGLRDANQASRLFDELTREVAPLVDDQLHDFLEPVWSGTVRAHGRHGDREVSGRGTLTLTGAGSR